MEIAAGLCCFGDVCMGEDEQVGEQMAEHKVGQVASEEADVEVADSTREEEEMAVAAEL